MTGSRAALAAQLAFFLSAIFLAEPLCSAAPVQSTIPTREEGRAVPTAAVDELATEGFQYQESDQFEEAAEKYRAALALAQKSQDTRRIALLLTLLGGAYSQLGHWQEAMEVYKQTIHLQAMGQFRRGSLGVMLQRVTPEIAKSSGLKKPQGALVVEVIKGGPAEQVGIERGDIIIEFNGQKIKEWYELFVMLAGTSVGEEIEVRVLHGGEERRLAVKLDESLDQYLTHASLGWACSNLGRWEEASEAYRRAIQLKPDYAEAYYSLGWTYSYLGRWQDAVEAYKQAIRIKSDYAEAHANLGWVHNNLGRYQEAVKAYQQAIRIKPKYAEAYVGLGTVYVNLGHPQNAVKAFERAIQLKPADADAYLKLGTVYGSLGRWQEAVATLKQAIHLKPDFSLAYMALGWEYFKLARYREAIGPLEQAIRISDDNALAYHLLGMVYSCLGRQQEAAEALKRLIDLKPDYAEAYHALRAVLWQSQRFSEVLLLYQQLWRAARELKNTESELQALMSLASVYGVLGDINSALEYYRQAMELFEKGESLPGEGSFFSDLALLHQIIGQHDKALHFYHRALDMSRETKDLSWLQDPNLIWLRDSKLLQGLLLKEIGSTYFRMHDYDQAVDWFNKSLQIFEQLPHPELFLRNTDDIYAYLGRIYTFQGQYDEALNALQQAETIARRSNSSGLLGTILYLRGVTLELQGKLQESLALYAQAVETLEKISLRQELEEMKIALREMSSPVYQNTVKLLFKLYAHKPEQNYVEQAFRYHEKGKGRTLLDLLEEAKVRVREGIDPALIKEEEKIATRIASIRRGLATTQFSKAQEEQVLTALAEQEKAYQALRVKMTLVNPKYAELTSPQIADIPQVQAILDKGTLLLEYALGEEKSFLWGVTQNGMQAYELPAAKDITQRLEQYLSTLREPLYGQDEIERHIELGRKLYRTLLEPAAEQLQGKSKLIIVPDGSLYYFPFEALIVDKGNTDSKQGKEQLPSLPYLVKDHTITYTPSASVLVTLEKDGNTNRHKKASSQAPLMAFGDPLYEATPEPRTVALNLRSNYERGGRFERLPYSAEEVQKIAGVYGVTLPSDAINLRERATEKRLREIDLTRYRVLHFATHAILSDEVKWITQPALVLTLAGADDTYDGFLQMGEIFNLRLDADLVVLSACDTGRGKLYRGEGVVGLTRAFMYAGTPSVVASLWKVNDQSTSLFMELFYRNLKEGQSKVEALRQAKKQLMQTQVWSNILGKEQSFAAPYFWAPFILVGSGN